MSAASRSEVVRGAFVLHDAPERPGGAGVVLVPPLGWEEVASHRARRAWAQRLAAEGHHVLRLDLPGTADSPGGLEARGLAAWVDAVGAAASRLRAFPGVDRVAVVGLGLGGLIAALAAGAAPIDDLLLWAAPVEGKGAVRRLRALGRLQAGRALRAGERAEAPPDGGLEVDGCVLPGELLDALRAVDVRTASFRGLSRALLLGEPVDSGLVERLERDGVEVSTGDGAEWEAFVADPEHVLVPEAAMTRTSAWLGAAGGASSRAVAPAATASPAGEEVVWFERPGGRLFGILARRPGELCVVLLNGGAVRHVGPSRMWVEAARRWAGHGVSTLRLDVPAVGESDGDERTLARVETMYTEAVQAEVRGVLDALVEQGVASRFVVAGLCSGAYHAFQAAVRDPRVEAVALLNPRALVWEESLPDRQEAGRLKSVASREQWRRLLGGRIPLRVVVGSARSALTVLRARARRRLTREGPAGAGGSLPADAPGLLEGLAGRGVTVRLGFSGGEPLHDELVAGGLPARPGFALVDLPSRDHALRPLAAQRAGQALVDDAVRAVVEPA